DHPAFGGFLDVSLLHRGEVAVEDDQRRFVGRGFGANFIQLAATYQRRGIRSVAHLEHGSGDLRSRAARELFQLRMRFAALLARWPAGKAPRALPTHPHEPRHTYS